MVQSLQRGSRAGWRAEEADMLFTAVHKAAENGVPLRGVFEQVGTELGRKPNSIRNYYYQAMRERPETRLKRAAPFEMFTQQEVHELLRQVLIARGQGVSVRACVMQLANGDKSLMLRYQNKYRSILKNRPELLEQIADELRKEGLPAPENVVKRANDLSASQGMQVMGQAERMAQELSDPAVTMMMEGLNALLYRAMQNKRNDKIVELDRLQVRYDLSRMAWEDEEKRLKEALSGIMDICRNWLALPLDRRREEMNTFASDIGMCLSEGETLLSRLNSLT